MTPPRWPRWVGSPLFPAGVLGVVVVLGWGGGGNVGEAGRA